MTNKLKPDGERFLTEFTGVIALEHYHRYRIALELVQGKDVLDIASGEGFGSFILSQSANSVFGVDISTDAVDHASAKYRRSNLAFMAGEATAIPLPDGSVDVVISFETIEHLDAHDRMMSEIKRVLRSDGTLLISSPNKLVYSDRANYKNPFHVRELYSSEFLDLIARFFRKSRHFRQRVTTASVITSSDKSGFVTYDPAGRSEGLTDNTYDILLASDISLPDLANSIYEEPFAPLSPARMEKLQADYGALTSKFIEADRQRRELSGISSSLSAELTELRAAHSKLDSELTETKVRLQSSVVENQKLNTEHERLRAEWSSLKGQHKRTLEDAQLILNSASWKLTSPLRKFANFLRRTVGSQAVEWPQSIGAGKAWAPGGEHSKGIVSKRLHQGYSADIPRVDFSQIIDEFVPYSPGTAAPTSPKLIAFYLPQFHPFAENDQWWGKGFTEWTNVGKAVPYFDSHYQPHCPIHFGYYDLRIPNVMEEQAALARGYGISGFAYYFYWFAGKVLMELPLRQMLDNSKVDIPFCLIWANENWTRRWDGQDNEVLIAQNHSLEDSRQFLSYLRPYFEDSRYIRVNGCPLLVIYRPDIIPEIQTIAKMWREMALDFGLPGLYLVCAQTFGQRDPRKFGFDAAMEFPPHTVSAANIRDEVCGRERGFNGPVYDYDDVVVNSVKKGRDDYKVFPAAMLSWDNTARKKERGTVFSNFSLLRYAQWMSSNVERVAKDERLSSDEKLVFVNAWNEWAEGTHLEPDQKFGYGYLSATRSVMENYALGADQFLSPQYPGQPGSSVAIVIHAHYDHTWPDLLAATGRLDELKPDIYVTVTTLSLAQRVKQDLPDAVVEIVDNRGRDIRPFLHVLRKIKKLSYTAVCKIHGKASVYRSDGESLRQAELNALLSVDCARAFQNDAKLGLLARHASLIEHNTKNLTYSGAETQRVASELGLQGWKGKFPAGSMFWFKQEALSRLIEIDLNSFDVERGLADGTRAHAIERLFCSVCLAAGYTISEVKSSEISPMEEPSNSNEMEHATEGGTGSSSRVSHLPHDVWHRRLIAHAEGAPDSTLPQLPPGEIQRQFVGSSFRPAFEEAYRFYTTLVGYSKALAMPIDQPDARFLDFGCGWGRFLRYAMNDFPKDRLHGVDIDPDILDLCRSSGVPAQFHTLQPLGKLPFQSNYFSHVMAYSVFTHLPERVHLNWSSEIVRVLRSGGVFCGTIETRKFLEFVRTLDPEREHSSGWHRRLSTYQVDVEGLLKRYDAGEFIYLPTGGGGIRTSDLYGDAVVPPSFIERRWKGASIRAILDERFWQTVVIIQKD